MQKERIAFGILVGVLALCVAGKAGEKVTDRLLEKSREKLNRMQQMIADAKSGNAQALFKLGTMILEEGREFDLVDTDALEFFLEAAVQGHNASQYHVSILYQRMASNHKSRGGCPSTAKRFSVQALAWQRVLVRSTGRETIEYVGGMKHARSELLRGHMTEDQIAEAERLSHEFEREIKRRLGKEESSK